MSRLRQNNSQNYGSSAQINEEFESIVRYINAAEVGNKTLSELLDILFDDEGNLDSVVELRLDSTEGLQYRSGTYTSPEAGWTTIVATADLRGTDGVNWGTIGEPIFDSRFDFTAAGAETELDIPHDTTSLFMVYKNGLLLQEGAGNDYTTSTTGGTGSAGSITFTSALVLNDNIVIFKIESASDFAFTRSDVLTVGLQSNFGFTQETGDSIQVYKDGILQTEGVGEDYYLDPLNDLVIFNTAVPAATKVAIISVAPRDNRTVTGLMTEAAYTDLAGLILFSKLAIANDEIPQAKVQDLVTTLAATPDITISATTPSPETRFWLDTSASPNQLKFYNGTSYISANPASALPSFDDNNANQFLKVDATGTVLSFADIDFSSLVPKTQKAAANGVASLDSNAKLPVAQLPTVIAYDTANTYVAGSVTNGSERCKRFFKQTIEIHAIDARLDGGTCDIQIEVDGVATGPTYSLSVTPVSQNLVTPITIDATTSSRNITVLVSAATGATNLDVALGIKINSQ